MYPTFLEYRTIFSVCWSVGVNIRDILRVLGARRMSYNTAVYIDYSCYQDTIMPSTCSSYRRNIAPDRCWDIWRNQGEGSICDCGRGLVGEVDSDGVQGIIGLPFSQGYLLFEKVGEAEPATPVEADIGRQRDRRCLWLHIHVPSYGWRCRSIGLI